MIDAERMLGSLVRSAMSGGRRRGGRRRRSRSLLGGMGKGTLALGALGVAIAAFEHLSQKQASGATASAGGAAAVPLPPPPLPPLPPVPGAGPAAGTGTDALLLVRAMIAAANADHELDEAERARILTALEEAEAGDAEKEFVLGELEEPIDLATLAAGATTPELASQIYLASLMAIDVDTPAERDYLDRLARRLGLDRERVRELEALGGEETGDES